MSATEAELGFGVVLKMLTSTGPDVYTTLGQQNDPGAPDGFSVDLVDATHSESPSATEEMIAGLIRTGSISPVIHYSPNSATVQLIHAAARVLKTFRMVWPSGKYIQFNGYVESFEPEVPTTEKMIATLTIKRSGPFTAYSASAPTNSVLPAISGTLDEGDTLTAFEGVWANEPTAYTYVWKNAGVAINGATGRTYVLVAGDAGDAITVAVTATNSAGSASATSAAVTAAA